MELQQGDLIRITRIRHQGEYKEHIVGIFISQGVDSIELLTVQSRVEIKNKESKFFTYSEPEILHRNGTYKRFFGFIDEEGNHYSSYDGLTTDTDGKVI